MEGCFGGSIAGTSYQLMKPIGRVREPLAVRQSGAVTTAPPNAASPNNADGSSNDADSIHLSWRRVAAYPADTRCSLLIANRFSLIQDPSRERGPGSDSGLGQSDANGLSPKLSVVKQGKI